LKNGSGNALDSKTQLALHNRISELEQLLEIQSSRVETILKDKAVLEEQLLARVQEKDNLIQTYESKIMDLQSALQDKIFAVDEMKNVDKVQQLQLELSKCTTEMLDLRNRYCF
jgi:hypothetical protein